MSEALQHAVDRLEDTLKQVCDTYSSKNGRFLLSTILSEGIEPYRFKDWESHIINEGTLDESVVFVSENIAYRMSLSAVGRRKNDPSEPFAIYDCEPFHDKRNRIGQEINSVISCLTGMSKFDVVAWDLGFDVKVIPPKTLDGLELNWPGGWVDERPKPSAILQLYGLSKFIKLWEKEDNHTWNWEFDEEMLGGAKIILSFKGDIDRRWKARENWIRVLTTAKEVLGLTGSHK